MVTKWHDVDKTISGGAIPPSTPVPRKPVFKIACSLPHSLYGYHSGHYIGYYRGHIEVYHSSHKIGYHRSHI
jgi:hypothetical protein